MKRKTLVAVLIFGCVAILYLSCYKTGEVIYQPECKPSSLNVNVPLYNFWYLQQQFNFNGSLTYDINRRLTGATTYAGGIPDRQYDFIYDGNNNLIKINGSVYTTGNPLRLILYDTISYPFGTAASLSSTAQVQLHLLSFDNITWVTAPVQTYNFNAQFQLVSVFQGNQQMEQLTYDNGGNCLADSLYDQNQKVFHYFAYSSYDNQINPARSDRSLQLFFQMYNKNNPTNSTEYIKGAGADPNGFVIFRSSSGNYTYNANGYPITYGGNFFADYNCLQPPVSAPGPGAN
jgi:hypothetical protein